MEREDWLALENTQALLKFVKEEVQSLGRDVLSGTVSEPENADKTQYMMGKVNGLYAAYSLVVSYMTEKEETEDA